MIKVPEPQPQSPSQVELHDRKLTIVSLVGCILEWYDFAAYGFFSDIIGEVFFPPSQQSHGAGSASAATIEAYVIFGAAFLMRPIGAILMGHVGDTRSRRTALTTSMFLMAVSTLLLGVLPTYSQVGTWAYVLLLIMRLLQGLSAGGNLLTSLVFTTENHKPQYRGLYAGVMLSSTFVGLLLGSMVSAILRSALTPEQLLSWGWRVPFLAGFLAILAAFYLKYRGTDAHEQLLLNQAKELDDLRASSTSKVALPMADAPVLAAPTSLRTSSTEINEAPPRRPARAMFARDNLSTVLGAFCMSVVSAFGLYFTFVWLATYMVGLSPHPIPNAYTVNSISIVIATFIELPLAGFLSDLYGRKRVMSIGATGLIVFSPLVMIWISLGNFSIALGSLVVLGSFYSLYVSSLFAWFVDSFDARIRSTALGVIYNTAQALVGGFAPTIATLLVASSSADSSSSSSSAPYLKPGYLVSGLSALAMVGLWLIAPSPKHPASLEPHYQPLAWSGCLSWRRRQDVAIKEASQSASEVSNPGLP
jgi:MFS transporter, MHS family, proline/betaine transporter